MKITIELNERKIKHLRELARWGDDRIETVIEELLERDALRAVLEEDTPPHWEVLSFRQRQVARLVCLRYTNRQIARRLGLSEETVKTVVSVVLKKLGVKSRYEVGAGVSGAGQPGSGPGK